MSEQKKKNKKRNFLYWLGNAAAGLVGIAVSFSDLIIDVAFPEYTVINKLGLPISLGLKFLWDKITYQKGTISEHGKKVMDKIPNKATGEYGSKKNA